jgi:hypothetical protein
MARKLHTTAAVRDAFVVIATAGTYATFKKSCPDGDAAVDAMAWDFLDLLGGMAGAW